MNEEKFSGKADIYKKNRPTYPGELIDYLYSDIGFSHESVVADIGAGTGIFSKLLARRNSTVICVEPNSDMLSAAKEELSAYSNCDFIHASAECTSLAANSVDFITVAQAFHWFDRSRFKVECRRIVKNAGKVVLVWNSRDSADELTIESWNINKRYCPDFKGFSGGMDENPESYADFFENGICGYKIFRNDLVYDEEGFIGRSLSSSYAPKENQPFYHEYINEMRLLFHKYCSDGSIVMRNLTRSYIGNVSHDIIAIS